nr:MAG TPA: hypothetical protein [Caudoviricetes sp.]
MRVRGGLLCARSACFGRLWVVFWGFRDVERYGRLVYAVRRSASSRTSTGARSRVRQIDWNSPMVTGDSMARILRRRPRVIPA